MVNNKAKLVENLWYWLIINVNYGNGLIWLVMLVMMVMDFMVNGTG